MTDDEKLVADLKALDEVATPGPWEGDKDHDPYRFYPPENFPEFYELYNDSVGFGNSGRRELDKALVLAMRNALPRLLAMAEEAIAGRAVVEAASPTVDGYYWVFPKCGGDWHVVELETSNEGDLRWVTMTGCDAGFAVEDYDRWVGPLPRPDAAAAKGGTRD